MVAENLTDCALVRMDALQQLDAIIDCRTGDLVVGGTRSGGRHLSGRDAQSCVHPGQRHS